MSASEDLHADDDPRSRAARTKRDRTRRALLDAADTAFGSRGWARTRMEDIAQAANVSAATAYNHFPTKHALLGHVYAQYVKALMVQAQADIASGRHIVEAIEDQVRALCRLSVRNRALTAALWAAVTEYTNKLGGPPDPHDDADPRTLAPVPNALQALIEHGQRTGELRSYPPAGEISGILVNTLLARSVSRPREVPDATAELLLSVLFGCLKPDLLMARDRPFRAR
jgi:AcrR family transcriptional regulator